MRRLALRLTDPLSIHTAAVSQAAAEEAIRRRVLPRSKCSVIANGIDCSKFTPQSVRRVCQREQFGLATEFVWLAVGRIAPAKDYPNFLVRREGRWSTVGASPTRELDRSAR